MRLLDRLRMSLEGVTIALDAMRANRVRAALTILGVAVGVFVVVVVVVVVVSFLVVSTTVVTGAGAAAVVSAAGASSFLAQAERTSTAATRAIRFIEIISMWRTRKAQRETAPWYAVLGRAEDTDTDRNVKASSMHHAWGAHAYAKRGRLIRLRRENTWSRHVSTLPEVQHCKVRSNCHTRN